MSTTTTTGIPANPLTLWVPVKQDFLSQLAVAGLLLELKKGGPITDPAHFIHFAHFSGIPNANGKGIMGILLVTDFDQPMAPYLAYFWTKPTIKLAFTAMYLLAETPPAKPDNQTNFENFLNFFNLTPNIPNPLSYAYTASVAQLAAKFPPQAGSNHGNPLTFWMPVNQDATSQTAVATLLSSLAGGGLITVPGNLSHYYRAVGVPNATTGVMGILIITDYDGDLSDYLNFFWTVPNIQSAFATFYTVATTPPATPSNVANFSAYLTANNYATPDSIQYAYSATVTQILAAFPPTA